MSDSAEHASGNGPSSSGEGPSNAERARTLVELSSLGSLGTLSVRQPGYPFVSVTPYAADPEGRPILLLSGLAMHTHNLKADPRASLLVSEAGSAADSLSLGRVTILGATSAIPPEQRDAVSALYLAKHPRAASWVGFGDFSFYRLEPVSIYYVGGFGVMGWVEPARFSAAVPDPLADAAESIIRHMNEDHAESLRLMARAFAGSEADEAQMTAVDRKGFQLRLRTGERTHGVRIAFERELTNAAESRAVFADMARRARAAVQ